MLTHPEAGPADSGKEPCMSIFENISRWISGGKASGNTGQTDPADTGDSWLSKIDPRFLPPPEGFDYKLFRRKPTVLTVG